MIDEWYEVSILEHTDPIIEVPQLPVIPEYPEDIIPIQEEYPEEQLPD